MEKKRTEIRWGCRMMEKRPRVWVLGKNPRMRLERSSHEGQRGMRGLWGRRKEMGWVGEGSGRSDVSNAAGRPKEKLCRKRTLSTWSTYPENELRASCWCLLMWLQQCTKILHVGVGQVEQTKTIWHGKLYCHASLSEVKPLKQRPVRP